MNLSSPVESAHRNLQTLMLEYRRGPIEQRVNLYVAKFSAGRSLGEYLADAEIKDEDKLRVLGALSSIVSTADWSRLPEPAPATNGEESHEVEPDPREQIRAIARREARAELADVLEKVARVLRETA